MNINDQLFIAAQVGNITKAIELITKGSDVDAVYKLGAAPLYIAAQNGHLEIIKLLLKKGADPEFKFSNGMTPLCIAAYNGHEAVAQMLLDYGADIEVKIGSATVLHIAVQNGQKKVAKLLLENGASLAPPAIVPTQEQTMLEILLQQGKNILKTVGCYDGLNREVFALEGIDYDAQNKILMETSANHLSNIKDYFSRQKIPLITQQIYFTSKDNPKEIDDLSLNKMILSAQRLNEADPSWKHYIWTNNAEIIPESFTSINNVEVRNIDELENIRLYSELEEMLHLSKTDRAMFSRASDLLRTMLLDKFGGVYFDLDYEVYRAEKLSELTKSFDFIGGKEVPSEIAAVGSAFIASIPNHPILKTAIDLLERNLYKSSSLPEYIQYPCSKWHKTWFETNPIVTTMAVYKTENNGTLDVILPSNVLYNVDYARSNAPGSRCYDPNKIIKELDKETIGADMFCGSWSATENFLNPFYYEKNINAYLYESVSLGYARIADYFLDKGANPNYANLAGINLLYVAAYYGHEATVKSLLEKDAQIDTRLADGSTALYGAALGGNFDVVKTLLEAGANTEIAVNLGHTPLYVAVHNNRLDIAELLLQHGANPNYDKRFTPFYLTEMLENKEAYKLLRSYYLKSPKTNTEKDDDFAVLIVRCKEPLEEVMEWALKEFPNDKVIIFNKGKGDFANLPSNYLEVKKKNIGYFGGSILEFIIDYYDELPNKILFLQADPYASPIFTPLGRYKGELNSTCSNIIGKCSRTTLQATTDFLKNFDWENDKHGRYKDFPKLDYDHMGFVHKYLSPNYLSSTEVDVLDGAQFAVTSDKILRHPKSFYEKIFYEAFSKKLPTEDHHLEKVWPLVFQPFPKAEPKNNAINTDALNQYLFDAVKAGKTKAVETFLKAGADIEYESNGEAALYEAAKNGHTKIVEILLKAGADIEHASFRGHTPLYAAIHEGKVDTVDFLIKAGASITDNGHRFTPFYIASALGLNRNASPVQKQMLKLVKAGYDLELAEFHKKPEPEVLKKTEYVFARYNEPIERIKEELPKDDDLVVIINKGEPITDAPSHWRIFDVENKGLDPQAYLWYTVNEYDHFLDRGIERVVFMQGIFDDHPANLPIKLYANNITSNCDNTIGKCENTTIQESIDKVDYTIKTGGWKTFDDGKYADVVLREYSSFERYINVLICPFPKTKEYTINWGNQYGVDVSVIMQNPVEYYQKILDVMNIIKPAEVHFFEMTNDLMFEPCPYERLDVEYAGEVPF